VDGQGGEHRQQRGRPEHDGQLASLTAAERQQAMTDFAERIRATGRFPRLMALIDDDIDPEAAQTRDARFEFGLDCLLDGIAARLML
jgi:Tetracyclin repressor-like, C-terminal domain